MKSQEALFCYYLTQNWMRFLPPARQSWADVPYTSLHRKLSSVGWVSQKTSDVLLEMTEQGYKSIKYCIAIGTFDCYFINFHLERQSISHGFICHSQSQVWTREMWELILPRTVPGCLYAVIWAVHHRRCPSDFYHGPQQHCSLGQWCHPPARKQITRYSTHCFIWMSTTAKLYSYFHSFWHPVCRHPSGSLRTLHDMSWMFTFLFSSMTTFLKEKELLQFAYKHCFCTPTFSRTALACR